MIKNKKIIVVKDESNPEPDKIIAAAILEISESMKHINKGPLKRKAIILLIRAMAPAVTLVQITKVLDCMDSLASEYLK